MRNEEVAELIVDAGTLRNARLAAAAYPFLGIRCPICQLSTVGSLFSLHLDACGATVGDVPAHWMAL